MRSTIDRPRRDGLLSQPVGAAQHRGRNVEIALQARMGDGERPLAVDALADCRHLGQPDRMVDRVLGPGAAAALGDDGEAELARRDLLHDAGALGVDGGDDRRRLEVALRIVEEVARPAERRDHASEGLGGAAGRQRFLDPGAGLLDRRGEAPEEQHLGRELDRHGVEARLAPAPGQIVDRIGDLDGVAGRARRAARACR